MLDWEWWDDAKTVKLFLWLVLKANHENKKWKGQIIERGQLITGLLEMAKALNMKAQPIRTRLKLLKSTGELTIKSTNRFSLITINNYSKYQEANTPTNTPTNKQLTNNQQTTNNKQEYKELKNTPIAPTGADEVLKNSLIKYLNSFSDVNSPAAMANNLLSKFSKEKIESAMKNQNCTSVAQLYKLCEQKGFGRAYVGKIFVAPDCPDAISPEKLQQFKRTT